MRQRESRTKLEFRSPVYLSMCTGLHQIKFTPSHQSNKWIKSKLQGSTRKWKKSENKTQFGSYLSCHRGPQRLNRKRVGNYKIRSLLSLDPFGDRARAWTRCQQKFLSATNLRSPRCELFGPATPTRWCLPTGGTERTSRSGCDRLKRRCTAATASSKCESSDRQTRWAPTGTRGGRKSFARSPNGRAAWRCSASACSSIPGMEDGSFVV